MSGFDGEAPKNNNKKGVLKALAFVAFMVAAVYLVQFTPVKDFLTREALGSLLERVGMWAPVAYMVV